VDEYCESALWDHDGIEFVPVVVLTTGGDKDDPKQGRQVSIWSHLDQLGTPWGTLKRAFIATLRIPIGC
jgi:hypothetical protein